ncbi:MAG: hypothetical protein LBU86_03590 [Oscillospiraceae bacterium]|jgi:hypothetical protein|nr:hypothetical protein [Oscillospiraceae bacterium]
MSGRIVEKLVAALLVLFLFAYVGVQASRQFSIPVKTETVYEYTVAQTLESKGIVFREEQVIPGSMSGIESVLFDDGERVLIGQPVVEYLATNQSGGNRSRLQEVEWEIAMLREAQNSSVNHFSNAEALGREIKQQLGYLVGMAATGNYGDLGEVRPNLVSLLNKRQIATGKESSFQQRLDQLEAELDSLAATAGQETDMVVEAPVSGYYARPIDGYESTLSPELAETATLDELLALFDSVDPGLKGSVWGSGRIITSQNWYIAVKANKYDVQRVREGQALELVFDGGGAGIPATVKRRLVYGSEMEDAVLILHSNYIGSDTVSLRNPEVLLYFEEFTGLRVDSSRLRFVDGVQGVYALENNVVHFKRVDPVYEEEAFILSRQPVDPYDTKTLRQYDQIITKGTDLEDGKVYD